MPLPLVESLKIEESYSWHKADWLPAFLHDTRYSNLSYSDPPICFDINLKQACGIVPDSEALLNHCQR